MESRKVNENLIREFQTVGQVLLQNDLEDSHSGNIALRFRNGKGEEQIVITASGSQKGDLKAEDICLISAREPSSGHFRASFETDIHARILSVEGVEASIHSHPKELTILTLEEEKSVGKPAPFIPLDPLGFYYLKGEIPVDRLEVQSGTSEAKRLIPERLSTYPATIIQSHGVFARGRNLREALFYTCIAANSGYIGLLAERQRINVGRIRERIRDDPDSCFSFPPEEYSIDDDGRCDFSQEEWYVAEFRRTGARIFESRLSPFYTGSISVRGVRSLLYAPKASMPRELRGPLLELPLLLEESDSAQLRIHKEIYRKSSFQAVLHCYLPEGEAHAHFIYPGERKPLKNIIAIDTEGNFIQPVIPVVDPVISSEALIKLLQDYRVVVVRGGGVWAAGFYSLSEVLHLCSLVREICLYRIGAFERGLDLKRLEQDLMRKK
ncbi:MAG: class II aldolase/adducin family protein [Candidatus Aminicenantales bacterium]